MVVYFTAVLFSHQRFNLLVRAAAPTHWVLASRELYKNPLPVKSKMADGPKFSIFKSLRAGSTDLCCWVTPVKSIYLLNVVVKQKILIKYRKQNRRRLVVLHATGFRSLHVRYCVFIEVMTKRPYTQY